jgi:hypothetical protein
LLKAKKPNKNMACKGQKPTAERARERTDFFATAAEGRVRVDFLAGGLKAVRGGHGGLETETVSYRHLFPCFRMPRKHWKQRGNSD